MSWSTIISLGTPTITFIAITISILATKTHLLAPSSNNPPALPRRIASPRETLLPFLSQQQIKSLSYPPTCMPGARDVETPFGTMRVYEWGPEAGRKVVLIHGDTTPGPMLAPIAAKLVAKGCRVMVFGTANGFSLIGFSLGGGISMAFAAHFPYLVHSIVLLAPAGVLRCVPDSYASHLFRYSFLVPADYLRRAVGTVLGVMLSNNAEPENFHTLGGDEVNIGAIEATEKADLDIPGIVQWQFDYHKGFCHSFIDTIAFGPIMNQHSDWRKVGDIIKAKEPSASSEVEQRLGSRLQYSKLLVVFGDSDDVVVMGDVSRDLNDLLGGPEHVDIKVVSGGHDFPVPSCDQVFEHIRQFWQL